MGIQVKPFFELFKQGKEVANAAAWKNGTISVNAVAGVLGAVAVVGIVNAVMHVITSKKVGLPSNGGN